MAETAVAKKARVAVLIVEDDAAMRSLLRDYLERDGFDVVDEATAEAAVGRVERSKVDAAIVDREMPGMSGLDFVSFLRRRWPDVPVIVITAFGGLAAAEEAFRRGATRYLEKPFRIDDLVAALRTMRLPWVDQ